jgi:hypothetical protein
MMRKVMIGRAKRSWQRFMGSKPGHRFQERYHRHQRSGQGRFVFTRIFNIVVGSVLVLVSAFFGWAPGPGLVTFFIGLGMIAGELLPVARFLDWAEVRLRKLARWARDVWKRAPLVGKVLFILAIFACVAALGYGAYHFFSGSDLHLWLSRAI